MSAPRPEEATLERRRMTRAVMFEIAVRLIGLLVVLMTMLFVIQTAGYRGIPLPAFLLPATAIGAILMTSATLVPKIFEGTMVKPIADALVILSVSSFVTILLYVRPHIMPEELEVLAVAILLLGGLLAALSLVKPLSARGGLALRSATLFAAAVLVPLTTPAAISGADMGDFRAWTFRGLLVTAFLSLLPLLRGPRNPYARAAGALLTSDNLMGLEVTGVLLLSLYFGALRPSIMERAPDMMVLAEWIVLVTVVLIFSVWLHSYLQKGGGEEEPGTLRRHVPAVGGFKPKLQGAAGAVDGFIAEGRKEDLLAMMTGVLRFNGTPEPEIGMVLQGIVRYQIPPAPRSSRRAHRDAGTAARREREALVSEMLARAASAVNMKRPAEGRGSAGAPRG